MSNTTITGTRLVTFLGTGNYSTVEYCWNDEQGKGQSCKSSLVAKALLQWSSEAITEVHVLGTNDSFKTNGEKLDDALEDLPVTRVTVPFGSTSEELWELFEHTKQALRAPQGHKVILDITHGFRAQPFFAAAVLFFLRAVDDNPTDVSVVYGADSGDHKTYDIWELTEFIELVDWALGLRMFLKTGRADEVATTTAELGKSLAKQWNEQGRQGPKPALERLGKALRAFGQDLEATNTGSLLIGNKRGAQGSATSLSEAVTSVEQEASKGFSPLLDVLGHISAMTAPLRTKELQTPDGYAALASLARLYLRLNRFTEAAATTREAWITRYSEAEAACPGWKEFDSDKREDAERHWYQAVQHEAQSMAELRNTLAHAGYNAKAIVTKKIAGRIDSLIAKFESDHPLKRQPLLCTTEPTFLNLSNHNSSEWSQTQRDAALAMASTLVDQAFPDVDPRASAEDITSHANQIAKQVSRNVTHAMIMGEHTLLIPLVLALQKRGVLCFAATTKRQSVDLGDDTKKTHFEFVAFREYLKFKDKDKQ